MLFTKPVICEVVKLVQTKLENYYVTSSHALSKDVCISGKWLRLMLYFYKDIIGFLKDHTVKIQICED